MVTNNKLKTFTRRIKSNTEDELAHATVKEAVQKRIIPSDHSSIIPGIDVNELKHSLDLLKYALDYSEAIVDSVRVPLIVLNKKLQVLTANRAFYDTFKLTPRQTENNLIYKLNGSAWNIPKLRILLEKILPANTHLDNYEVEIDLPHLGDGDSSAAQIIFPIQEEDVRLCVEETPTLGDLLTSYEDISHFIQGVKFGLKQEHVPKKTMFPSSPKLTTLNDLSGAIVLQELPLMQFPMLFSVTEESIV